MSKLYLDGVVRSGELTLQQLVGLQIIDAGNVAEYFYKTLDKDEFSLGDFPNMAPPFSNFYIEYRFPDSMGIGGGKTMVCPQELSGMPIGVFISGMTKTEFSEYVGRRSDILSGADVAEIAKNTVFEWALVCVAHFGAARFLYVILVDENGGSADPSIFSAMLNQGDRAQRFAAETNAPALMFMGVMGPALMTISFMHCRNVIRVEHDRAAQPRRARRNNSSFRHYTLEIEPMKQVLRTDGQSEKTGIKKALHICRGHFAHYGEKPLFGKYSGTFWVPAHTRGSLKNGAVSKDYKVSP